MPGIKSALSRIVLGLACLGIAVTLVLTLGWISIVIDHELRGGVGFRSAIGPLLSGGLILIVVLSGAFYLERRQRCDLWSLILSSVSLLVVLGETITLFCIPLHGPPWP